MAAKKRKFSKKTTKVVKTPLPPTHRYLLFAGLLTLALMFLFLPGQHAYFKEILSDVPEKKQLVFEEIEVAPLPVNTTGVQPTWLAAQGVYIEDVNSAVVLYQRNSEMRLAPASLTKMMTALVVLDHFKPDDRATVNTIITEGRLMGLQKGEKITVENLLYGILIHSGNDAAYTLAENYPGGVAAFVAAMNKKAQDLELINTSFANPMGFDDPLQYSTPRDLAKLAKVVLENPTLLKMVGIPNITVSDESYSIFHPLTNVNELVGRVPGVAGVKTGFTENAGESLVTLATRNGNRVIIVLLHSPNRFAETENTIKWIFENHVWKELKVGQDLDDPTHSAEIE